MSDSLLTLLAEIAQLDGYGRYVWPAYGLSLALMLAEPWLTKRRLAQALRRSPAHDDI